MKMILPSILIVISLATFFVFINPHYKSIKGYREKVAQYDEALNNEIKLEQDRDALSTKYHNFPADTQQKLIKLLPDNADNIRLVIDIQKIAVANGVNVISTQFDTTQKAGQVETRGGQKDYGVFDLEFSISGTYKNFLRFLKAMESSLRITDIQSVAFSSGDAKDTYTFQIKVKTYWLRAI
jgi:Tfp pilus assembly protein PilO